MKIEVEEFKSKGRVIEGNGKSVKVIDNKTAKGERIHTGLRATFLTRNNIKDRSC